jgi:hypothetical protein
MKKLGLLVIFLLGLFLFLPTLSFAQRMPSQRSATALVSSQTNEYIQSNKQQKANASSSTGKQSSLPSEALFFNKKHPLPTNATAFTDAEKKEKLPSNAAKVTPSIKILKPPQ